MATSRERQKANLARMKRIMEEIESTTDDYDLIVELQELLRKPYPLSLKWHMIVFKNEIDRSLWYLEDIRKEEIELEKRKRRRGKEIGKKSSRVNCKFSEKLSSIGLDSQMVYDVKSNKYKLSKSVVSRTRRANVFAIPKSMIGEFKLQWSDEVKQIWGEDNIGKRELLERGICN
ncbi:MAG: hypothetical protein ACOX7X_09445 [Methanosarcina flavescens]|uniref:Uncharacterized protein n=1 Tax=Methanosarcina flavescens TaxID=1715806 RepID=A0A660HQC0_9EURY|nr:hypothetical protein [Methanosarcina flavescens]AYK14266.1 hypothetical protein AOB57_002830 [Methanosarcina flavescens]NLK31671.1 hypothetical protein [Methanosarcina flavescens]